MCTYFWNYLKLFSSWNNFCQTISKDAGHGHDIETSKKVEWISADFSLAFFYLLLKFCKQQLKI